MKFLPNALFLSVRKPAVTYSRLLYPNSCSTNAPNVTVLSVASSACGVDPAVTVVPPGARFSAKAPLRSNTFLTYWTPAVVREVSVGLSTNDAVASAFAV